MSARRVVVVTAGVSRPSSTRLLADRLATATSRALADRDVTAEVEVVELREHAHALTDALLTGFPSPELASALRATAEADAVVAVTPIFSASYSGLFKTFFDVLDRGSLTGTPVLLAATAGTARHSLALEHAVRPLFSYLRAVTVPTAVFAASEDWGAGDAGDELARRVDRAAGELAGLLADRPARPAPRTPGTALPDAARADALPEVTPFAQLLAETRR